MLDYILSLHPDNLDVPSLLHLSDPANHADLESYKEKWKSVVESRRMV